MSGHVTAPLLETIEPDDPNDSTSVPSGRINSSSTTPARQQVVLTPTNHAVAGNASTPGELESGEHSTTGQCVSPLNHMLNRPQWYLEAS